MVPETLPEPSAQPNEPVGQTPPLRHDLMPGSPFARLLERRIVFLRGPLQHTRAADLAAQLIHLDAESAEPVTLYIHSTGGATFDPLASPAEGDGCQLHEEERFAMLALYDTIQLMKSPVHTVCLGIASSAGAFLLATGTGTRSAAPNARIMIRQPLGSGRGTASDITILAGEFEMLRQRMEHILAERTGQTVERIHADMQRDFWMSAAQARDYGIVDEVAGG